MLGNGSQRGAPYPAAPHGLLFSDGLASRKAAGRWASAARAISMATAALGLAIFGISAFYLSHMTETTGMVLGGVLVLSGVAGYAGGARRSPSLVNLQLVASLVGILLAFSVISETVRDAQVDCALAELYHRGVALDRRVASLAQKEAMHAVYARLGELEDQLGWVQHGAAKAAELKQGQEQLRMTDLTYIRAKVDMVKLHAEQLLDSVLKNENLTAESIGRLSEEDKALLRRRMDTADAVLQRIQRHHTSKDEEITFQEYQEILAALSHPETVPHDRLPSQELEEAKSELPNMKAALERSRRDNYGALLVGDAPRELARLDQARRQQRERFEAEFSKHLERQQEHGSDYLVDLPQHCVRETAGERAMVGCGLASIALQLAAAFVALSLSFRLPVKAE